MQEGIKLSQHRGKRNVAGRVGSRREKGGGVDVGVVRGSAGESQKKKCDLR